MKKIILFLLTIICSCFVGCNCNKVSISSKIESIDLYKNEHYELNDDIFNIKGENVNIYYEIDDTSFAVIYNNIIYPQRPGKTKLIAYIDDKHKCEIDINIIDGLIANNVTLTYSKIKLNLFNRKFYYNKIISDKYTEIPKVTYDNSIISYDYLTGEINAKSVGKTTVIIKFKNIEKSFEVEVNDTLFTTNLVVDDSVVDLDSKGLLAFVVYPKNSNTFTFSCETDIIEVTSDGYYRALKSGIAEVNYSYISGDDEPLNTGKFNVIVKAKGDLFNVKIVDLNGSSYTDIYNDSDFFVIVDLPKYFDKNKLKISNNVNLIKDFIYVDGVGFKAQISFLKKGKYIVNVDYLVDSSNKTKISNFAEVNVWDYEDTKIILIMDIYILQDSNNDNIYNINLQDPGLVNTNILKFAFRIGNRTLYDGDLYLVVDGNEVLLENKQIDMTHYNKVIIKAKFKGLELNQVTVNIKNKTQ